MNWIQHPVWLESARIRLVPLESAYFPQLLEIGSQEKIWEFMTLQGGNREMLLQHLKNSVLKRAAGEQYPFVVIDKVHNMVIGSTMLHSISAENRRVEIGYTWYDPAYWATGYNTECKLLLLTYCFETLKTARVQFQANDQNVRSKKAILKIGATFEGTLRKERSRPDGTFRDTAMFSIIDDEWAEVKRMLIERIKKPV